MTGPMTGGRPAAAGRYAAQYIHWAAPAMLRTAPFVLLFWLASCSFQDESLVTVEMKAPTAEECGGCHVAIYEEWTDSKHAGAFTSDAFREQTFDHQVTACLPCHVPETVATGGEPVRARSYFRSEGVSCIACHLVEGEHHGPFFTGLGTPHATKADPDFFFDAALCGTCHAGTYGTWQSSRRLDAEIKTCQQCHMGAVRRKMTQATGILSEVIVALHEEQDLRRHTFDAALLPEEDAVKVALRDGGAAVAVTNLLPHSSPTGDFGFRKVLLTVDALGADGASAGRTVRALFKDLDTELEPSATLTVPVPAEDGAPASGLRAVRVALRRVDRAGTVLFTICDEVFELDGTHDDG